MGVSSQTKYTLWGKAAGHCELCAKPLDEGLYRMRGNYSNIAHIKAQSAGGPRYDSSQTDEERHGIGNLMLLCPGCHETIDNDADKFPVEWLLSEKFKREEAIARFASNAVIPQVDVISCFLPINAHCKEIEDPLWKNALFDAGLSFKNNRPFSIDSGVWTEGSSLSEAAEAIASRFAKWEETVGSEQDPVAVFAMAPQPLLIKLGALIGDKHVAHIFQWHRADKSWSWPERGMTSTISSDVPSGSPDVKDANLIVSISGEINSASIPEQQRNLPTATLWAESPSVEIASCPESLDLFARELIAITSKIHAAFPALERLHLFPAMPVSMAVKLGTVVNFNLIKSLIVYEKDAALFHKALVIGVHDE